MDETDTVIHRKARAAKQGHDARAMSPSKAMRLALSKVADSELGLPLSVTTVEQIEVAQSELRNQVTDDNLMLLLDGAAGHCCGAALLDAALLMALIEQQTIGHVGTRPPTPRPLTRTDAALIAPFLDTVFTVFDKNLEGTPEHGSWTGYRFGAMMEEVHGLCIALNGPEYHLVRMTVDLSEGTRVGVLTILVPVCAIAPTQSPGKSDVKNDPRTLENIALEASVPLQAVLSRIDLPLDQALALNVGDVLEIRSDNALVLRLEGARGHLLSEAKLGQMNGSRAIRLIADDDGTATQVSGTTETSAKAATATVPQDNRQIEEVELHTVETATLSSLPEMASVPMHGQATQILEQTE